MSYCRFSKDSDVYVFGNSDGYLECQHWPGAGESCWAETPAEMLAHLRAHVEWGDRVPADVLAHFEAEAAKGDA